MSEQTETSKTADATVTALEKITKPSKQAKASIPANVIVTEESNGTVIFNAVAL